MRSRFMTMGISAALACVAAAGQVNAAAGPVPELPAWVPSDTELDAMVEEALQPFEWTTLVPNPDSRLIFVSSSEGNDANDGLSPERPVRSIRRGYELLRDGEPDWLLLKRGDVWEETFGNWKKSGRSVDERMVVTTYGESAERPTLLTGTETGLSMTGTNRRSNIAFTGFAMRPHLREAVDTPTGLRITAYGTDLLIEDVSIEGYKDNVVVMAANGQDRRWSNVRVRGCIITDSWSLKSHSQGLYLSRVDGAVIEGCVFDHNGWGGDFNASQTIFNHNLYLHQSCGPAVVRGNIIARASAHGLQARSGGLVMGNLVIDNPIGLSLGVDGEHYGLPWPSFVVGGTVAANVVVQTGDIGDMPRGSAITLTYTNGARVARNVIADARGASAVAKGIVTAYGPSYNVRIIENAIAQWEGKDGGRAVDISSAMSGVVVGNRMLAFDTRSRFVDLPADTENFEIHDNIYMGSSMAEFRVGSDVVGVGEWEAATGEEAAIHLVPEVQVYGVDQYLKGEDLGSLDAYLDRLRTWGRSEGLWQRELYAFRNAMIQMHIGSDNFN